MPRILDNIQQSLLPAVQEVLEQSKAAAICVGYLNLRGWSAIAEAVERLAGGTDEGCCRVLVGMHRPPEEEMRQQQGAIQTPPSTDGPSLARLRRKITESFREQIEFGIPSSQAEATLRQLARQLRAGKVRIKAFLRHPLHAKLYLFRRPDRIAPLIGFVGSSNLTLAGLSHQGELNVDVVEQDAAQKLQHWFEDRWNDPLAYELTEELATLIETSWVRTDLVRPYLVYLKIAYHLSQEAREGESELKLPALFHNVLFNYQRAAVSLAVQRLHRRGGVLLGDVAGLGKTLMASAVARIFQEDDNTNTLILCPPNLTSMWQNYVDEYQLIARIVSIGKAADELPELPRFRLVIIDECQYLRNREGKRYRAIRDYILRNEARVILLSGTPYNKHFTDLSNQLRLFVHEDSDLHLRPERYFQEWSNQGKTEADFIAQYQTSPCSLRAFEQSSFPEDWRDLMRLFLVRRTRQFIIKHYAKFDPQKQRHYVLHNSKRVYFPLREPQTISFPVNEDDPNDQYAHLFHDNVVAVIQNLLLPRYGLANYLVPDAPRLASTGDEKRILANLNRAGRRLIGFCRTNLFKRLESSGYSFLVSLERHILRNLITYHALNRGQPVPVGTQDPAMLDAALRDTDDEFADTEDETQALPEAAATSSLSPNLDSYHARAEDLYQIYRKRFKSRFDWLPAKFFQPNLSEALLSDSQTLLTVLQNAGPWRPDRDAKLAALYRLLHEKHFKEKVLVFTQFADTATYLADQLKQRGLTDLEVVTSSAVDPCVLARRFSPPSNKGLKPGETELRILIATDVLSEGQNLQDCHIVVNYDLPWAIVRLIQRAGRVDRIGQQHDTIFVYSFLPAEGVERIIRLRARLFYRLQQNQEVIGTDETFLGEAAAEKLRDLYTEKAHVLDDDPSDQDIDLASLALQVWNSAARQDREAARLLPPIVSATAPLPQPPDPVEHPPGVITYLRFPDGADALVRVDSNGKLVSQSFSTIFQAAACAPDTPSLPRAENHHELVARSVAIVHQEQTAFAGQLGSIRRVRRKIYDRLNSIRQKLQTQPNLFAPLSLPQVEHLIDRIWRYPLKEAARDSLSRQLRLGISDHDLLEMLINYDNDNRLCEITEQPEPTTPAEPQVICSLGLRPALPPQPVPPTPSL